MNTIGAAKAVTLLALGTVLAGCSGPTDRSDLQAYVAQVLARSGGAISPVPEFKTYETFNYTGAGMRNPFRPVVPEAAPFDPNAAGPQPDLQRNREALENFPLDTLKFVGDLELGGERWAIVTAPDELVYRVQVGNYMGQNYGRITDIDESRIALVELVPNGSGGWVEREAAVALAEE